MAIALFEGFPAHSGDIQIAQQSVVNPVSPAVDGHLLSALPRGLHNRRMSQIVHLFHHVQFTKGIQTALLWHFTEQRAVLKPDIADMQQPVVDKPQLRVLHRRLHAAAAVVAADNNVLDFRDIDGILHHRQTIEIGVDHRVRYVTMHEQFAGLGPVSRSAGTRLSEQPIHRKRGFCVCDSFSKSRGPLPPAFLTIVHCC